MLTYPSKTSAALSNFGAGHLNISEAASLIAKCLFCEGKIEANYDVDSVSLHDPKLEDALKEHITFYEEKLVSGIKNGSLKADLLTRDIDENVIKNETFIDCEVLESWLDDRSIYLGDLYYEDFLSYIGDLLIAAENSIQKEKIKRQEIDPRKRYEPDKEYDYYTLYQQITDLEKELARLKKEPKEKSLSTRTRETTLKLIIGMAVAGYGYNPKAKRNVAVTEIASDLHRLGIPITDDTVRAWLDESIEFLPINEESSV
jgi:hypothetical protein